MIRASKTVRSQIDEHFRNDIQWTFYVCKMICDKCRAGQMIEYERTMLNGDKKTRILGHKCDRCGYTLLDSDDDIWSIVGL
ncbi:MAG TPA: hypothetical protein VN739_03320 [Nitrososphaerales archaeon]|nr:hypothetical protein [Nitrososphaerales archaeon]